MRSHTVVNWALPKINNEARFSLQISCCPSLSTYGVVYASVQSVTVCAVTGSNQAYRTISTGQLSVLLRLHLQPIDEVVYLGPQGYLVLRGASRLDAFSGYPVRS